MGNNTSSNDVSNTESNDSIKLNQDDCTHGYNDEELGEYAFRKSDLLENVHYKNDYNEALAGDRASSGNAIGVVQDVVTVHTEPARIADACNDCEIKIAEPIGPKV
jgi:hypothetical protein